MATDDKAGMAIALEEARAGEAEGGVPIGACLVSADGRVLGRGHNMRVQENSPIIHAETAAVRNAGRLPASVLKGSTMYTTLSPCIYCSGLAILYNVQRVVIGENKTFLGGEDVLHLKGVKTHVVDSSECFDMMQKFIREHPDIWNEDIST